MPHNKATTHTLRDVFDAILAFDHDMRSEFCDEFNLFLDDLRDQDMFGTEGQIDPRGDPRS